MTGDDDDDDGMDQVESWINGNRKAVAASLLDREAVCAFIEDLVRWHDLSTHVDGRGLMADLAVLRVLLSDEDG